jgi:uncharacterized protein
LRKHAVNPFYFGTPDRRLFGVYTPARKSGGTPRGAVLCYPWGQEYIRAHRSMRILANLLAGAGVHVLRFDYFGTGDSAGDGADGGLRSWSGDIDTAIDELVDTSGATRVALIGLRLGATLAAEAAGRRRRHVNGLVLWDPVLVGQEYLNELMQTISIRPSGPVTPPPRRAEAGGGHEVLGFPLTNAIADELRTLTLSSLIPAAPARTLVLLSNDERPSPGELRAALQDRADAPDVVERIASLPAWLEDRDSGAGAVPVRMLQRIVQWFG